MEFPDSQNIKEKQNVSFEDYSSPKHLIIWNCMGVLEF
jgi:hypothetical protein